MMYCTAADVRFWLAEGTVEFNEVGLLTSTKYL